MCATTMKTQENHENNERKENKINLLLPLACKKGGGEGRTFKKTKNKGEEKNGRPLGFYDK